MFRIYLLLFLANISFSQEKSNQIVPIEILLKKEQQHSYSISPDGNYFAEIVVNNLENDIVIIDIKGYKLFKRIPIGNNKIDNLYWLTSNRLLYQSDGEIYAIDKDGSNSTLLVSRIGGKIMTNWSHIYKNFRYNNVLSLLPDKGNYILIETYDYKGYSTVKEINVFTGQKIVKIDGSRHKMVKWLTNQKGEVKIGIKIVNNELRYCTFNPELKKWEQIRVMINNENYDLKIDPTSYLNQNLSFENFVPDSNRIYLTSNVDSNLRKLISYDLDENRVIETIVEDPSCDISSPDGKEISFIYDKKEKKLVGLRYNGLIPEFKWFSEEFENIHLLLKKNYPKFISEILDMDDENQRMLIYQWSDHNAGNIGIFDSTDYSYSVMVQLNEELNNYKLSETINLTIYTRDNYQLQGYLNPPVNRKKGEIVPLIVIPHGGPWARDYWELDQFSQYFSTRGYATLRINYRGSTGFGKKHINAGVNNIDSLMIDDIADGVKYIIDKFSIDPNRVFIFGHSYGGYATYMSLLRYSNLYKAGVAVSAPSDIKAWIKTQKKEKHHFTYEFWKTALGSRDTKYLNKISPINYTEHFKNPILIFHGKHDKTISVEQAIEMEKKLKKYNKDVTLEILEREGHSIHDSNSLGYILDSSKDFFEQASSSNKN